MSHYTFFGKIAHLASRNAKRIAPAGTYGNPPLLCLLRYFLGDNLGLLILSNRRRECDEDVPRYSGSFGWIVGSDLEC
ncbi:MAG: hypothetical protein ACRC2T_14290 [Thermoguttaceae bacterium]